MKRAGSPSLESGRYKASRVEGARGVQQGPSQNRGKDRDNTANDQTGNTYRSKVSYRDFPKFNSVAQYDFMYESWKQSQISKMDHKCFDYAVKNSNLYSITSIGPISMTSLLTTGDSKYNQYTGASITPTSLTLRVLATMRTAASNPTNAFYTLRVFQWDSNSTPPTADNMLTDNDQTHDAPSYIRSPRMTYRDQAHYVAQFKGCLVALSRNSASPAGGAQIYQEKYISGKNSMIPIQASPDTDSTLIEGNLYYVLYTSGVTSTNSGVNVELQARCTFTDDLLARKGGK